MKINEYDIKPYAIPRGADLRNVNLCDANLRGADLRYADLRNADLRNANLRYADLRYADLCDANLCGVDLDFSCWPFWCGSKEVKIDEKQAKQLLAHAFNVAREFWPGFLTKEQIDWLNDFHRIKSNEFPKFEKRTCCDPDLPVFLGGPEK